MLAEASVEPTATTTAPEVVDDEAYARFCAHVAAMYGHLTEDQRWAFAFRDLCRFLNDAYNGGDADSLGRLEYCMRRIGEAWDEYIGTTSGGEAS